MKKFFSAASISTFAALTLGTGFFFSGQAAFAAQLPASPYTVKAGDTLYSIAEIANFPLADLLKVNGFSEQTTIYPGEKVALPFMYKVESGDQLGYLAQRYGTTVNKIKSLNGLNSDSIYPGMKLLIARGSLNMTGNKGNSNTSQQTVTQVVSPKATTIAALATAYDGSVAENGPAGAVDYFGDPLQFGDIAVDPSVIPLGTKVKISGYSDSQLPKGGFYATAVDTGGAIKGNRIDIYLPTTKMALNFGVENVKVTVF